MSEVLESPVNLWEEGRMEDELSPEEIQMVWHLRYYYSLFMSCSTFVYESCVSHERMAILRYLNALELSKAGILLYFTTLGF